MKFEINNTIKILESTPDILQRLLGHLPEEWTNKNEGGNTWSPYDIIGHLIHGEKTDWIPRAKIIIENEQPTRFIEFDRFAQFENSKGKSIQALLSEFSILRNDNIVVLKSMKLDSNNLKKEGIHPEFGKVNLAQLFSTWMVHDLGHIHQITRVLAHQHHKAVGPWVAYLGVFNV